MNECKPIDWEMIERICVYKVDQCWPALFPIICCGEPNVISDDMELCTKENCPVWEEL